MQITICRTLHTSTEYCPDGNLQSSAFTAGYPQVRDVDKTRVGATIKALRKKVGLTQLALGQRIDERTGQNLISRWESGTELPSVEKIAKLAGALGTTTDHLLLGEEPAEGESELREFQMWVRTMAPNDLTDSERAFLAAIRWPQSLGSPEPEWYDDALTTLRGIERKAARRRRGPRH
jgi:transcriptional regulator with XRE-family HTH domain